MTYKYGFPTFRMLRFLQNSGYNFLISGQIFFEHLILEKNLHVACLKLCGWQGESDLFFTIVNTWVAETEDLVAKLNLLKLEMEVK